MDWTIVTVTYNSRDHLQKYWHEFRREQNDLAIEWVVVDNASSDGSAECAQTLGASVIQLSDNLGFSSANNIALNACTSDYIAFVNPDVRIVMADLARLAETVDDVEGLVAPQLVNSDHTPQANARGLPYVADKLAHRGLKLPGSQPNLYLLSTFGNIKPVPVLWFMGAAVCARTQVMKELGGWNEKFFIYYEDHELGLRAWEHGIPVIIEPRVEWEHAWQRETTKIQLGPWRREIAAASSFYRLYPQLMSRRLSPRGRLRNTIEHFETYRSSQPPEIRNEGV